jgi:nucleoside-diphosphate-sugar epimerase
MEILVIGGTKFIGPHVVRALTDRAHTVTVFHRGEHESGLPSSVRHVHDRSASIPGLSFPAEVRQRPFDVVIHMIAMGEHDAAAAVHAFRGKAGRLVVLSSGDVYRAYGRFAGLEVGPAEEGLLKESSPLRFVLYPYRTQARSPDDWVYSYDKILVERAVLSEPGLPAVVLRLPKVYGPGQNDDLATVYGFRHRPQWRWTHGYVENVAHAIVLAVLHPSAAGVYNVGEQHTPTVAERLADLPASSVPEASMAANFDQNIVFDTTRIRDGLGYSEPVGYREGLRRTLGRDRLLTS